MMLPPARQGASEPMPPGATRLISWLSASTTLGADASASVMWTGPGHHIDAAALHGVKYAVPPVGVSLIVVGDTVPAPAREVSSTIVSVLGSPFAFVP